MVVSQILGCVGGYTAHTPQNLGLLTMIPKEPYLAGISLRGNPQAKLGVSPIEGEGVSQENDFKFIGLIAE